VPPANGRLPGVFRGYLDNELQDAYVWRGGVYHTGDAAWKDENGRFWFHGRFDDIIKTGGFRVGPAEVENVLLTHPAVLECGVIGIPDPLRGQAIRAVVVPAVGYLPDRALESEIRDYCNGRLAEYKWVRSVEFVSELPRTISGKVRRTALRNGRTAGTCEA
ncbi:MAG: acetyl-CoA synthetase, partial [Butyricicoccaceae bacterium]